MKTTINKPLTDLQLDHGYFNDEKNASDIKIVDYLVNNRKGQIEISLFSEMFWDSSLKISLSQNKIIIIISEIVQPQFYNSAFINDWQSYSFQPYIRMRNVSMMLPGDNFILLRHFVIPEKYLLKIFLRKVIEN
ncbi:MAG: hypothetical protein JXR31_02085 [Prolixibacteraceae bacterium]|nr:hypothetical protein [Prolixibacteraceae bacterium]MBN2773010.1 hypothetical protein [Prolixibacteraceae bacterium]